MAPLGPAEEALLLGLNPVGHALESRGGVHGAVRHRLFHFWNLEQYQRRKSGDLPSLSGALSGDHNLPAPHAHCVGQFFICFFPCSPAKSREIPQNPAKPRARVTISPCLVTLCPATAPCLPCLVVESQVESTDFLIFFRHRLYEFIQGVPNFLYTYTYVEKLKMRSVNLVS